MHSAFLNGQWESQSNFPPPEVLQLKMPNGHFQFEHFLRSEIDSEAKFLLKSYIISDFISKKKGPETDFWQKKLDFTHVVSALVFLVLCFELKSDKLTANPPPPWR